MEQKELVQPSWKGRLVWTIVIVVVVLVAASIIQASLSPILSSFAVDQVNDSTSDYMQMNWVLHQATFWARFVLVLVVLFVWRKWFVYLWKKVFSQNN